MWRERTFPCRSLSISAKSASGSNGGSSTTSGQRLLRRISTWITSPLSRKPELSSSAMSNSVRASFRAARSCAPLVARAQLWTAPKSSMPSLEPPSAVSSARKALLRCTALSLSPILSHSASNPALLICDSGAWTSPSAVSLPASSSISITDARRLRGAFFFFVAAPPPGVAAASAATEPGTAPDSSAIAAAPLRDGGAPALLSRRSLACGAPPLGGHAAARSSSPGNGLRRVPPCLRHAGKAVSGALAAPLHRRSCNPPLANF